jgi:hypothetical protein
VPRFWFHISSSHTTLPKERPLILTPCPKITNQTVTNISPIRTQGHCVVSPKIRHYIQANPPPRLFSAPESIFCNLFNDGTSRKIKDKQRKRFYLMTLLNDIPRNYSRVVRTHSGTCACLPAFVKLLNSPH